MFGDNEHTKALLERAARARGHAKRLTDARTAETLSAYADELEAQASKLREEQSKPAMTTLPEEAANAPTGEPHTGPEMLAAAKTPEPPKDEN
jgi:hypothetical protein